MFILFYPIPMILDLVARPACYVYFILSHPDDIRFGCSLYSGMLFFVCQSGLSLLDIILSLTWREKLQFKSIQVVKIIGDAMATKALRIFCHKI